MPRDPEPRTAADRPPFRAGVIPIEVDHELLLLDASAGLVVRLDREATAALARDGQRRRDVLDALAGLGLTPDDDRPLDRRGLLRAAGLTGLGISVLALPSAAAAVSTAPAGLEPFALATGTVAPFNPNANGSVNALLIQADGRIVVGGAFSTIGGVARPRIARIHPNGAVDPSFDANMPSGTVLALAIQSDGRVVVGGNIANIGGTTRNRIARLNTDGSLDDLDLNLNANVNGLAIQEVDGDEMIVATGAFFVNVGTTRLRRLARLFPDGTPDPAWNGIGPGFDGHSLLVDQEGGVIVGHAAGSNGFWFGPNLSDQNTVRAGIARIGPDDVIDTSFPYLLHNTVPVSSTVRALATDEDGRIYLGGSFETTFGGSGIVRRWIARIASNGAVDTDFAPELNGSVLAITIQSDGRSVIGGAFTTVDGQTRNRIARLHGDTAGTSYLDTTFDPNAGGSVNALAMQQNGRIVLGGAFSNVGGEPRGRIARLD